MSVESGKVHKLESAQLDNSSEHSGDEQEATSVQGLADTQKDMSKVALIVSLLAVILLVIFFFGMNRNIAGLTNEVKSFGLLREDVSNLDQRMVQMQQEMPSQIKKIDRKSVV